MRSALRPAACVFLAAVTFASTSLADEPPPPVQTKSYALPLGLSYLVAPALTGVAIAVSAHEGSVGLAPSFAVAIVLGLAAPVVVHVAHHRPIRAYLSPLAGTASTAFGAFLGYGISQTFVAPQCKRAAAAQSLDYSSCSGEELTPVYIGAATGYVAWAVLDTIFNASEVVNAGSKPSVTVSPTVSRGSVGLGVVGSF